MHYTWLSFHSTKYPSSRSRSVVFNTQEKGLQLDHYNLPLKHFADLLKQWGLVMGWLCRLLLVRRLLVVIERIARREASRDIAVARWSALLPE